MRLQTKKKRKETWGKYTSGAWGSKYLWDGPRRASSNSMNFIQKYKRTEKK